MQRGVLLLVLAGAVAAAVTAAAFVGAAGPSGATASSHREAPLIGDDPAADNTDVYAFVSPDNPDTVTIIANYIPFEDPAGGPNYYRFDPTVLYELNIDNNGDADEDVTLPVPVHDAGHEPEHLPLQHRSDHIGRRSCQEPERQADVLGHARGGQELDGARLGPPCATDEHRTAVEPWLQRVRRRRRARAATAGCSPGPATIRSSSISGRSSTSAGCGRSTRLT